MKLALAMILAMAAPATAMAQAEQICDGVLIDAARDNRRLPVRVRLPAGAGPHPVILFSHGLGGSVAAGTLWATAWAKAGFAVIHIQHPGSDASLMAGATRPLLALRAGMTPAQYVARVSDMKFVIGSVGGPLSIGACPLSRLDASRIGIAGHSFGAQTVQAVAGQQFATADGLVSLGDARVRAAIALSPAPAAAQADDVAFARITMPFLSVTGTADELPMLNNVKAADRTRPYRAMPAGEKYLLVADGADHMLFSGGEMRRTPTPVDLRTQALVTTVTTWFWQRTLGDNPTALPPINTEYARWESK